MPRIYVEFSQLSQLEGRCKTVASKIDVIQENFQRTVQQLDWDIRFESDINSTATKLSRKLEQYSRALESYQSFIKEARSKYAQLDNYKQSIHMNDSPQGIKRNSDSEGKIDFDWKDL